MQETRYVNTEANGNADGLTPGNAWTDLQDALDQAPSGGRVLCHGYQKLTGLPLILTRRFGQATWFIGCDENWQPRFGGFTVERSGRDFPWDDCDSENYCFLYFKFLDGMPAIGCRSVCNGEYPGSNPGAGYQVLHHG